MKSSLILGCLAALASASDDLFFFESFDEDVFANGKWVKSKVDKYSNQKVLIKPSNTAAVGFENDKGLVLSEEVRHYAIGSLFDKPFTFSDGNDMVLQYEVKLEEGLQCGGAYIKLIREKDDGTKFVMEDLDNETPYSIMFGPDHCGALNNKIHFIMQHKSEYSNSYEQKHFKEMSPMLLDKKTHLYTALIRGEATSGIMSEPNSIEYFVDMKSIKHGSLFTHMDPPINPSKEINDPNDSKPADWVDEEKIPDPDAVKPDDWDDDAPPRIPDPSVKKPPEWDESNPEKVPDPDAVKPKDWDDEEDGEWEAPLVRNPACDTVQGCGPWVTPMIKNPEYKGKWNPPFIPNPAFIGAWKPKQIPNPDQSYDAHPVKNLSPIVGIAIEVWTTSGGITFDNILLSTDIKHAWKVAEETFLVKSTLEKQREENEKKEKLHQQRMLKLEHGSIVDKIAVYFGIGSEMLMDASPATMAVIVGCTLTIMAICLFPMLGSNSQQDASKKAENAKKND